MILQVVGQVTLRCPAGSTVGVDVAVTSPFSTKGIRSESPGDSYALTAKHAKYDAAFKQSGFVFCALVLETTGGVSHEGTTFLKQLFRFAARRQNVTLSVYAARAWARMSCIAQAILNRVSGMWEPPEDALQFEDGLGSSMADPSAPSLSALASSAPVAPPASPPRSSAAVSAPSPAPSPLPTVSALRGSSFSFVAPLTRG